MVRPAASNEALDDAKAQLRARMRARRDALSAAELARASRESQDRVLAMPHFASARSIALFSAARGEPSTEGLARAVLGRGAQLAYPRVEKNGLAFRRIEALEDLLPGGFGLLEPALGNPSVEMEEFDFVLVPGLAFDSQGRRLGYGKGYYDRALPGLRPGAATVGFCHDFQLIEEVPSGPRDIPVREIVTDRRRIRCS